MYIYNVHLAETVSLFKSVQQFEKRSGLVLNSCTFTILEQILIMFTIVSDFVNQTWNYYQEY